jgi:6-phosphogluconolactonase (cycloisomerase 2 family)
MQEAPVRTIFAPAMFALILALFCAPMEAQTTRPTFLFLLEAKGVITGTIHVFSVDASTGALTEVPGSPFDAGLTPDQLVVDPTGRFVYVVNSQSQDITALSVDPATGALTPLPGSPFPMGATPVTIAVEPTGRFLYVFATNLVIGVVQEFLYEYIIDSVTGVLTLTSSSPTTWELTSGYIFDSIAFAPGGNYAYLGQVTGGNTGALTVVCSVDFSTGTLAPIGSAQPATTGVANQVAISPNGGFLYSINTTFSQADAFTIGSSGASLTEISGSPYSVPFGPSSLAVHPTGNFLYIANSNSTFQAPPSTGPVNGSIYGFSIDSGTGTLTPVAGSPYSAGVTPGSIVADPGGNFAYVTTTTTGTPFAQISGYSINIVSGVLAPLSWAPWTDSTTSNGAQLAISNGPSTTLNPSPMISSLSPPSSVATDIPFTLQINGANFMPGSMVYFGGQLRTSSLVSSTQLNASILATDIDNDGNAVVFVFNPLPGGGASTSIEFPVSALSPVISSISPPSVIAASIPFTLSAVGSNFVASSVISYNGIPQPTEYDGPTLIRIHVTPDMIGTPGTATVSVTTPSNGVPGGGTSDTFFLTILPPQTQPVVTNISPTSATEGGSAFTLIINGSGFVASSQVSFNMNNVPTTLVSSTQLTAIIPASAIAVAGYMNVVVTNPVDLASSPLTFTVTNPLPGGVSVSAGNNALTLSVIGTGFVPTSVVFVNGNSRVTTYESSSLLQATLLPGDLSQGGTLNITVVNSPPGGGTTSPISVPVNPVPKESSLSPSSVSAGSAALTVAVIGSNFNQSSTILVNGTALPTTHVSAKVLEATLPASDLTQGGTLNVSVMNPSPGGGTSPPLPFVIDNPQPGASSVTPPSLPAGSNALTLTVTGTGFTPGSVVLVNGSSRVTTYASSTSLQSTLMSSDLGQGGTLNITVMNPPPGGGNSAIINFTVTDYMVMPSKLSPPIAAGQTATFVLTLSPSLGTFSDPVTFGLSTPLPAGAAPSFAPLGPITPGVSPQTVTLSITTTPHTAASTIKFPYGSLPRLPMLRLAGVIFGLAGIWFCGSGNRVQRLTPQLLFGLLMVAVAGLIACGAVGAGPSSPTPSPTGPSSPTPISIAGDWTFSAMSSRSGAQSTFTAAIGQTGSNISGSWNTPGSPCGQAVNLAGTLNANSISASLSENGLAISVSGTVSPEGNSASGNYSAPSGGCTKGDAGTWSGTRPGIMSNPATGTPAGTYSITVTATSGTVVHTTTVTLTVM